MREQLHRITSIKKVNLFTSKISNIFSSITSKYIFLYIFIIDDTLGLVSLFVPDTFLLII